jgi:hypothetical protein
MILKGSSRGFQVWPPTKIVPRKVLERMIKIKKLFINGRVLGQRDKSE